MTETPGLVRELDILTLCELQVGLEDGRVRQLAGDGLDTRLRHAARTLEADRRPIPLGRASDLLDTLVADIAASSPEIELVTPAGDVRRFESLVFALAIVGRAIDPPSVIDAICATGGVDEVRHRSGRRAILSVQQAEIDIRVATPDEYGTCLFHATGSPAHLHAMHRRSGTARLAAREEDLYANAGLPFITPELRQGSGEVEAAAAGALPALISREHIRGDLHLHTNYSDGADTLDAMVEACRRLEYEYIAITDHSERAAASRTLRERISHARRRY